MKPLIVDLPLLTNRKTLIFQLFTWMGFITFPLLFVSFFLWSGKITLVFLVLFIVCAIVVQLMRSYEVVGAIRLTQDEIIIRAKQEKRSFSVVTATKIQFSLMGIFGEFNRGRSVMMNQGDYNYLKFRYMDEKFQFRFLMREDVIDDFRSLLEVWREHKIAYGLYNGTLRKFPKYRG